MKLRINEDAAGWKALVGKLRAAGCVFAEEEARLLMDAASSVAELDKMAERRAAGYPLEHIVGWAEFCGLRIRIDPGVFVPRRRTEFLAGLAARITRPGDIAIDLCCGSGALGAALANKVKPIMLHAVDIDPVAVQCARRNIAADIGYVYEGDLYEPLPERLYNRIAVIVANAPYVPTGKIELMPAEARIHEAAIALDGGADGLDVQRRIVAEASRWLAPGGVLLVETSERQAKQTAGLFSAYGLFPEPVRSEDYDATVIVGFRADRPVER
ncbi:putative protein N(5)-glutamine methyltransferase [Paenibacillus ginsengarvi]|uniref:putative protein N(5)-glutamine methyltransferase n=1 Tax=Paenibacillus ginsengarvi TaxID=400777 RepID=UPI001EFFF5B0|nr:putative protein N(5)-glutamine methyltransferase [Paenibacillus ginsengarvi]